MLFLILRLVVAQVDAGMSEAKNECGNVFATREYVPEYRSGGSAERGIRRSMEDAHVCVDDIGDKTGSPGAFYGVRIISYSYL